MFGFEMPAPQLPGSLTGLRCSGKFSWVTIKPDGQVIDPIVFSNIACTAGLNLMLETMFRSGAAVTTWYASIIASGASVSAADTMASHAGWSEFTSYSGSNRPIWTPAAASGGIVVNTSVFSFTLTADMTNASGLFITSGVSKGASVGTLFSTGLNTRSASNGDVLQCTYTITLTPS